MNSRRMRQLELWPQPEPGPAEIVARALSFDPISRFALFSGGDDSLAATAWAMENVADCRVLHINTGIGVFRSREYVRDLCSSRGWPLIELRALEDCGQDYEQIVREHGFPGPAQHKTMYARLKERCVRLLVRQEKAKINDPRVRRRARVMLLTGIRHDESVRRMGYGGQEVSFRGAQMWVNHVYWQPREWFYSYARGLGLPRNPVRELLGISGECLCGAFAGPGELALIRMACPRTAERIEALEVIARAHGHDWRWGERPPGEPLDDPRRQDLPMAMCAGCGKRAA